MGDSEKQEEMVS